MSWGTGAGAWPGAAFRIPMRGYESNCAAVVAGG